ncbi:MAG: adenylosuccinate synthase [Saprospiraceae bacterium]
MKIDVILGLQWGDEGKGKIVDYLADKYDIVARFQGGPNAGHTLIFDNKKFVLHTVPSGIFRPEQVNLIGNGVVLDPITFEKEIKNLEDNHISYKNRLLVSRKAHLILPSHRLLDAGSEAAKGKEKIGSTLKGIGPTYMDKTGRNGLRVGDIESTDFLQKYKALKNKHLELASIYPKVDFDIEAEEKKWFDALECLKSLTLVDAEYYINEALTQGKKVLAEGAQGSMLDIDFGTYPFVTSSNTLTAGVCIGLGVSPSKIGEVIGITKAYCTRVGSGPFPSELDNEVGEKLRKEGFEFGSTTGRSRRCGWIDLVQLKYTIMLNGVTQIVLTKIDVLNIFNEIGVCTSYSVNGKEYNTIPFDINSLEIVPNVTMFNGWNTDLKDAMTFSQLPKQAQSFVQYLEKQLNTKISIISTSPDRNSLVFKTEFID